MAYTATPCECGTCRACKVRAVRNADSDLKRAGRYAIGYARVSTGEQVTHGYGLDVQREMIEQYAAEHDLELVTIMYDNGISGTLGLDKREGLATLVMSCGRGVTVIIPRLDRLARDVLVQESALREMWQKGAEVVSCEPGESDLLRPDSVEEPTRKFIRVTLAAAKQLERDLTIARTTAGRRMKREMGGYAGGRTRKGWNSVRGTGVVHRNLDEQRMLVRLRQLKEAGNTFAEVADLLAREGWRNKAGEPYSRGYLHRLYTRMVAEGLARPAAQTTNRSVINRRSAKIRKHYQPAVRAVDSTRGK